MKKTIYIAGKVTGSPIDEVTQRFAAKEAELKALGHVVINPVWTVQRYCMESESWEAIMRLCISKLMQADEIHLLPCWCNSRGAMLEHQLALTLGIPVVYSK